MMARHEAQASVQALLLQGFEQVAKAQKAYQKNNRWRVPVISVITQRRLFVVEVDFNDMAIYASPKTMDILGKQWAKYYAQSIVNKVV